MRGRSLLAGVVGGLLLVGCGAGPHSQASARAWPLGHLAIGEMDGENGAKALAAAAPLRLRYQYLSGGVNTSQPWPTWGRGDGNFVSDYVSDSASSGMVPVFTYYEMRQSLPGSQMSDEATAVLSNLRSATTMRDYWANVTLMFQKLAAAGGPAVVHVEPDLWGYVQQQHGDNAANAYAAVAASGVPALKGLPDNVSGFAQAFVRLRDQLAPNVTLGYALSIWGTGKDITISNESNASVDALARRSADFYRSLHAPFDTVFGEFADRTSGYAQVRSGRGSEAWWDSADFARHARFMADFHGIVQLPMVMWQIPLGNTVSRSMDNTPGHYQDNRVQWLLSSAHKYRNLRSYRDGGTVALLFGPGQGDDTHASDADKDGVTNPAPITGNRTPATSADDDGGYFDARVRAYVKHGALAVSTRR